MVWNCGEGLIPTIIYSDWQGHFLLKMSFSIKFEGLVIIKSTDLTNVQVIVLVNFYISWINKLPAHWIKPPEKQESKPKIKNTDTELESLERVYLFSPAILFKLMNRKEKPLRTLSLCLAGSLTHWKRKLTWAAKCCSFAERSEFFGTSLKSYLNVKF